MLNMSHRLANSERGKNMLDEDPIAREVKTALQYPLASPVTSQMGLIVRRRKVRTWRRSAYAADTSQQIAPYPGGKCPAAPPAVGIEPRTASR